jgi:hypothetical protein
MPQELSPEQEEKIRLAHFQGRVARCPFDDAIIGVEVRLDKGVRPILVVSCPLCGLNKYLA